jgi:uncharacterized membrane protein
LGKQLQGPRDIFWRNCSVLAIARHDERQNVQTSSPISRIDGLDVARGIALIAMASFHFSWDLELFGFFEPGTASGGFLKYYARGIATSFLFIVGFSLVLATLNGVKWRSFLKRLTQVGAAALVISIATYYTVPDGWIFFGILHHITVASLIGLIFIRMHWAFALLAAAIAFALPYLGWIVIKAEWLSFLGLFSTSPSSNDFVPLFPWLAASLTGIAAAKIAVANNWIEKLGTPKAINTPARQLKFLGQHSLLFYILHQPVLIGLVWLASQIIPTTPNTAAFQTECKAVCGQQFTKNQCLIYCNCFENELVGYAAQSTQLPANSQSKVISEKCTKIMRGTP